MRYIQLKHLGYEWECSYCHFIHRISKNPLKNKGKHSLMIKCDSCKELNMIKGRVKLTKAKRARVYKRDGEKCLCCGSRENLTIDHIIPKSLGGENETNNMQVLCKTCNMLKGDKIIIYRTKNRTSILRYIMQYIKSRGYLKDKYFWRRKRR